MAKRKDKLYAIVDIETTGGMAKRDKITEIAIIVTDGQKVLKTFDSLVNPERSIPNEITRITGITNEMVKTAPKFYEIAKQVVDYTEGTIFVAHNVNFDYSFLREEFSALGYTFSKKQLCTVKLSRKAFPGLKSYALGNLIAHFGIQVNARHRAFDDAYATTDLFSRILAIETSQDAIHDMVNKNVKETRLPNGISLERLHELPEKPGVYYMYNNYQKIIYIGKSINIKSRMMQHFAAVTRKTERMIQQVAEIGFEETGHELLAIILESYEIKKHLPEINKSQRTNDFPYFLTSYIDQEGFINFKINKLAKNSLLDKEAITFFGSLPSAKGMLSNLRSNFGLCESKINANHTVGQACIYRYMGECAGACIGLEAAESYNIRASAAIEAANKIFDENFFILVEGRTNEEMGLVLVEEGFCKGYGYISKEGIQYGVEELKEAIDYQAQNFELNRLISLYLQTKSDYKILKF